MPVTICTWIFVNHHLEWISLTHLERELPYPNTTRPIIPSFLKLPSPCHKTHHTLNNTKLHPSPSHHTVTFSPCKTLCDRHLYTLHHAQFHHANNHLNHLQSLNRFSLTATYSGCLKKAIRPLITIETRSLFASYCILFHGESAILAPYFKHRHYSSRESTCC